MPNVFSAVKQSIGSKEDWPSGISTEGTVLFFVLLAGGIIGSVVTRSPVWAVAGALIGIYFLLSIRVADQWEKAAVLRPNRTARIDRPA